MENNYLEAKRIVNKRYQPDDSLYPFMVVALYGLLCKFHSNKDLVEKIFLKTQFYLEPIPVSKIIEKYGIDSDYEESEDTLNQTYGVSNQGNMIYPNQDGKLQYEKNNPLIICTTNIKPEDLLNTFCHEMSHLIKGEENGYFIEEQDNIPAHYLRTGLAFYYYIYYEEELECIFYLSILDESINCIQTTEILEEILTLKEWVEDSQILTYLKSLKEEDLKKDLGYPKTTKIIRNLWKNEQFKQLIENNIVEGNIKQIEDTFDYYTYEGALIELGNLLDEIYYLEDSSTRNKKIAILEKKAESIIREFKKNTSIVYRK